RSLEGPAVLGAHGPARAAHAGGCPAPGARKAARRRAVGLPAARPRAHRGGRARAGAGLVCAHTSTHRGDGARRDAVDLARARPLPGVPPSPRPARVPALHVLFHRRALLVGDDPRPLRRGGLWAGCAVRVCDGGAQRDPGRGPDVRAVALVPRVRSACAPTRRRRAAGPAACWTAHVGAGRGDLHARRRGAVRGVARPGGAARIAGQRRAGIPAGDAMKAALLLVLVLALAACDDKERLAGAATGGDPTHGRKLIRTYGCGTCHEIPGSPGATGTVGPS